MRTDLVVYDPTSPILCAYCDRVRLRAWKARNAHADRMDAMTDIAWSYCSQYVDLNEQIRMLRLQIASVTKGVPQTELVDDDHGLQDHRSEEERRAHQQVLKKAWKYVAQRVHPDKGGRVEEFQFLKECYEAGDLRPLTEYILQIESPLEDQIAYWTSECQRPDIEWNYFKRMDQYAICQSHMRGDLIRAELQAKDMLRRRLAELEREFTVLRFHLHPEQIDENRKERSTSVASTSADPDLGTSEADPEGRS